MINLFKKKTPKTENNSFEIVKTSVIKILDTKANNIQLNDLQPDTKFEEIGFNSIMFISLLLGLEDAVNVDLEILAAEIDLASIHTLGEIAQLIDRLNGEKQV